MQYFPEGSLINFKENSDAFSNSDSIKMAIKSEKILEGIAIRCDENHNLIVAVGNNLIGIIPRTEGAIGIAEGLTKDIALISKVGKPVCFVISSFDENSKLILSRKRAQELCYENFISKLTPGDVIPAVVTHFENYGSFVDIGCGIASLIPIDAISISRITHPSDRFKKEQKILINP